MTMHISPDRLGLPPPVSLDLTDAGRAVGWLSGNRVGFRGFANEVEAAHAAWVAYRTLSRRLARRNGTRPIPVDIEPIALQRRGHEDVILASGRVIATLVRPGPGSRAGADSFGFELAIPHVIDELGMRSKAYFVYRTLRKAGTRWALWEPPAAAQPYPEGLTGGEWDATERTQSSPQDAPGERSDSTHHQRGGYRDVTQHSGERPWWLRVVPWGRAGGLGRGTGRRAVRV